MFEEVTDGLAGIELTEEGRIPQREIEFITDEDRAREIEEPARLHILRVLKRGIEDTQTTEEFNKATGERIIRQRVVMRNIMSVVEIVKMSAQCRDCEPLTKNQVYHHLPKLIETGYVVKYGTVTTGKRTTDFYRRTAKGFVIATRLTPMNKRDLRRKTADWVERMCRVFRVSLNNEERDELSRLLMESFEMESQNRRRIARMIRGDVADAEILRIYEWLVETYAIDSDDYVGLRRRIKQLLFDD